VTNCLGAFAAIDDIDYPLSSRHVSTGQTVDALPATLFQMLDNIHRYEKSLDDHARDS